MTNPFASIVGLRGLNNEPRSLFVNDLPGISTELVTALRKDDQTVADTWVRINSLAMVKLASMLELELNKSGEFKHTVAQSNGWSFLDGPALIGPSTRLYGCRLQAPSTPFGCLMIEGLYADLTDDQDLEVKIVDMRTGTVLDSQSIAMHAGAFNLNPVVLSLPVGMQGLDVFVGCAVSGTFNELGGAAANMISAAANSITQTSGSLAANNLTATGFQSGNTGIWVSLSVVRSIDALISRYADALKWSYAHLVGSLLMSDKRASTRINLYTSTNLEYAAELEDKLLCEARDLLKPIARRILSDLDNVPGPVVQADSEVQVGYYRGSMLG